MEGDYATTDGTAIRIEDEGTETTVEIRIKTLDSANYTVRVAKDVPVPALKDQLASLVGVPAQNQRLICRGKVLKDDQLLSSYNVEDGHTLHLVARPIPAVGSSVAEGSQSVDSGGASSRNRSPHITHSVVLGAINMPETPDIGMDLNRIVSAVLNSVGTGSMASEIGGSGRRGVAVMQMHSMPDIQSRRDSGASRPDAGSLGHDALSRELEVPSDALTTLSLYLNRMEQAFSENGYGIGAASVFGGSTIAPVSTSATNGNAQETASNLTRPLPTPTALGGIARRVQNLLHEQASSALNHFAGQLENEPTLLDTAARGELQASAVWTGNMMQQLGALLMELGRTTLTLRLGQSPAQAIVNCGPAIFVSPSGPNPMMVQPLPFVTGLSLGGSHVPSGATSTAGPTAGSGLGSRSVNIHIHANELGRLSASPLPSASSLFSRLQNIPSSISNLGISQSENISGSQVSEGHPNRQQSSTDSGQHELTEAQDGIMIIQENDAVRLLPLRSRAGTGNNSAVPVSLPNFTSGDQGNEPRSVRREQVVPLPLLGIRAHIHAQPWTQAVMQASEGQRPVGIAVTLPLNHITQPGDAQSLRQQDGLFQENVNQQEANTTTTGNISSPGHILDRSEGEEGQLEQKQSTESLQTKEASASKDYSLENGTERQCASSSSDTLGEQCSALGKRNAHGECQGASKGPDCDAKRQKVEESG